MGVVRGGRPLAVSGAVLVLLLAWAPMARAETLRNTTIDVPAEVHANPCAPEPVLLHGQRHMVVTATSDGAGGYHATVSHNTNLEGRGLVSAVPYRASQIDESVYQFRPPFPAVVTAVHNLRLIAQGTLSNYLLSFRTRIVVDEGGIPFVVPDGADFRCTG